MIESSESDRPGDPRSYRPERIALGPLYRRPLQPAAVFKWFFGFPGYFWPWQALFTLIAWLSSRFLTPDRDAMEHFSAAWMAPLLIRNGIMLTAFISAWHLLLYTRKSQGINYKYNSKWLAVGDSRFLFRHQLWDNVFWSLCSAVPIWTAYEVLTLWMEAHGFAPTISWAAHPTYNVLLVLLIPLWLNIHFYTVHRLIHWPPLYKAIHSLHHKNINVGPWSGLAMHPVEHLLYFSAVMLFWIVPAHPLHVLYLLQSLAFGPVLEHHGFDRVVLGKKAVLNTDHYMHYLHHKYVKVNFSTDAGLLPLDKWLGTFHDGSDEAQEAWKRRLQARALRVRQQ